MAAACLQFLPLGCVWVSIQAVRFKLFFVMLTDTTSFSPAAFEPMMLAVSEAHDLAEATRMGFLAGESNPADIDFEAMSNVSRMLVQRLDTAIQEFENIFKEKGGEG